MAIRNCFFIALVFFISSCATLSDIPRSTKSVNFESSVHGELPGARIENYYYWRGVDKETVLKAAEYSLKETGATIEFKDEADGTIIGEYGISLIDWNAISGVYVKGAGDAVRVAVITQSSHEPILGLGTEPYNERLVNSMQRYLMSVNPGWRIN